MRHDRVLALVTLLGLIFSLLLLGVRVGTEKSKEGRFLSGLRDLNPAHADASAASVVLFQEATNALTNPLQLPRWPRRLMVAELRVSCVDCGRPIPFAAAVCPFCEAKQPGGGEGTDGFDTDRDGIPDEWEKKYGLNWRDPTDGEKDKDLDGFSNLEEYKWDTDPNDPASFPAPVVKLRVIRIEPIPFKLKFMAVSRLAGGDVYQLNLGRGQATYFAKMGQEIEGFKVARYEKKEVREGLQNVDKSVLTLERHGTIIRLTKGEEVPHEEYAVALLFKVDNSELRLKVNSEFELKGRKYQVKGVDIGGGRVLVSDASTGKETWIDREAAEQKSGAGAPVL
jgi:hypothetical protein